MLVLLFDLERAKSLLDCERSRVCVCANDPERGTSRTMPRAEDCEDADEARRCRMRCVGSTFGMLAIRAKRERTGWVRHQRQTGIGRRKTYYRQC
jgi:hypothetical protein